MAYHACGSSQLWCRSSHTHILVIESWNLISTFLDGLILNNEKREPSNIDSN